jgi:hypothetical protein
MHRDSVLGRPRRRTSRTLAAVAAGLAVLGACSDANGSTGIRTSVASPPVRSSPQASSTGDAAQTLTERDAGRELSIAIGGQLTIELAPDFLPVLVSDTAVVATRRTVGGYPSGRRLVARLMAVRAGTSTVSSSTDYPCLHEAPRCALPIRQWKVFVKVI